MFLIILIILRYFINLIDIFILNIILLCLLFTKHTTNLHYNINVTVMLSAESAAGKYPVESVTMQQLIINKVEVSE